MIFRETPAKPEVALEKRLSLTEILTIRGEINDRASEVRALLLESHKLGQRLGFDLSATMAGYGRIGHGRGINMCSLRESPVMQVLRAFDACAWQFLLDAADLPRFMGPAERDKWHRQLESDALPELSQENVEATFAQLMASRHAMMVDGFVTLMKRLSWDYKTNTPCQLGPKIIMENVRDRHGYANSDKCMALDDLDRVFFVLAGTEVPPAHARWYSRLCYKRESIAGLIAEGTHFTVKTYKNGNAHIAFHADALPLLGDINRLVATRFPSNLPPPRKTKRK